MLMTNGNFKSRSPISQISHQHKVSPTSVSDMYVGEIDLENIQRKKVKSLSNDQNSLLFQG